MTEPNTNVGNASTLSIRPPPADRLPWAQRHGAAVTMIPPASLPQPEKFSYGHRRVKSFIFKMKDYFLLTASGIHDRTLIQAFMLYLSGPALAWAMLCVGDDAALEAYPHRDDFDAFLNHFGEVFGANTQPAPRSLRISQEGCTVDEYVGKFYTILSWIDDRNLDLATVFYNGLTPTYRELVNAEDGGFTSDLTDLIIKTRTVDARLEADKIERGERKLD
ncbi:uncharacterized protein V2V93DRAFT_109401 [Kockiozyma suomiensis]|uniref:uncharacterized protein n=1 Tax=Kockiozyma suomiensis TaxID=1337062 RepID=UPI0033440312